MKITTHNELIMPSNLSQLFSNLLKFSHLFPQHSYIKLSQRFLSDTCAHDDEGGPHLMPFYRDNHGHKNTGKVDF